MTGTTEDADLLSPRQVHTEYGFTPRTLANWRRLGTGPEYIKTTDGRTGRIRYRRSTFEAWLNARTVSTESASA
ncbi:helix-turn-helix transcriptional regulator [Streptomyces africanus]|uniref:helix-turn-helix transcriptional regulator n=1 Tax=Streptomyces africanus TaxID=231024 RepID=UPI000A37A4F6|nr:helix-turn-helix domain-containing protein [Streptomyces africanus]